jgi:hypothetical protein
MDPLHRRSARRSAARVAGLAAVAALGLAACDVFDSDDAANSTATATESPPEIRVTVPPSRLTPFCQAIIDLRDEIQNDPPADTRARIIEVYERIVDDAPADIRDDFVAVLASLQTGEPAATAVIVPPSDPPSPDPTTAGSTSTESTATDATDARSSTAPPASTAPPGTVPIDPASTPPTSDVFEDVEGYDPDTSPTLRLNLWIQENCRSTVNNPGPADTEPPGTNP